MVVNRSWQLVLGAASLALVLVGSSACSSDAPPAAQGAGGAGAGGSGGGSAQTLGLNDITMLVPLPSSDAPVLFGASDLAQDGAPILPKALVEQVLTFPGTPSSANGLYEMLHVVGVRFDLCDRATAWECAEAEDARFRLVFQPIQNGEALDIGFHVFYAVPRAAVPDVVAALRELAVIQGEPKSSPLRVSPGLTAGGEYTTELRALIAAYCSEATAVRVTTLAQPLSAAAFRWILHGIEKKGATFAEIAIPSVMGSVQEALFLGQSSYQLTPPVDAPKGLLLAASEQDFAAAPANEQAAALDALAKIDNPLDNVPNTVQCLGCHLSTILSAKRAASSGVDPAALPSRYKSSYDTSVDAGDSASEPTLLRGLGWRIKSPAITQRVANETAQALSEIEARF